MKTKIESAWPCDRETKTPPVRLLRKDLISHMRSDLFASAFLNQNSQPDTTVEAERLRMFTAGIDNNYCNLIGFLFCKQSLCRMLWRTESTGTIISCCMASEQNGLKSN